MQRSHHLGSRLPTLDGYFPQSLNVCDWGVVVSEADPSSASSLSDDSAQRDQPVVTKVITPLSNILLWAALRFHTRRIRPRSKILEAAFVPLACNPAVLDSSGFIRLPPKHRHLHHQAHPAVFVCVLRNVSEPKTLECHMFACASAEAAVNLCILTGQAQGRNSKLGPVALPPHMGAYSYQKSVLNSSVTNSRSSPDSRTRSSDSEQKKSQLSSAQLSSTTSPGSRYSKSAQYRSYWADLRPLQPTGRVYGAGRPARKREQEKKEKLNNNCCCACDTCNYYYATSSARPPPQSGLRKWSAINQPPDITVTSSSARNRRPARTRSGRALRPLKRSVPRRKRPPPPPPPPRAPPLPEADYSTDSSDCCCDQQPPKTVKVNNYNGYLVSTEPDPEVREPKTMTISKTVEFSSETDSNAPEPSHIGTRKKSPVSNEASLVPHGENILLSSRYPVRSTFEELPNVTLPKRAKKRTIFGRIRRWRPFALFRRKRTPKRSLSLDYRRYDEVNLAESSSNDSGHVATGHCSTRLADKGQACGSAVHNGGGGNNGLTRSPPSMDSGLEELDDGKVAAKKATATANATKNTCWSENDFGLELGYLP